MAAMTIVCGMCVNLAYMELVRTEQRLATDAAAKAASVTLGRTQSEAQARAAAVTIASKHQVAGNAMALASDQIIFGVCDRGANNALTFTPGPRGNLLNAVSIDSNLESRAGGGAPLVMLPTMLTPTHFSPQMQAIASRVDLDVCVVVDRSGSMAWDLTNVPWSYPGVLQGKSTIQNYFQLPHATQSRWAALSSAMSTFLNIVEDNPFEIHVAMASYSSNFTFGVYSSTVASLDQPLTLNYALIENRLSAIASKPLIGNTNIAAGLREGINSLTDPATSRTTACKVLILITDGVMTQGDDPVALASLARNSNIRVHTIAFSAQADANLMRNIAAEGGGNAYLAPSAETLTSAFQEIASTLPAMLAE